MNEKGFSPLPQLSADNSLIFSYFGKRLSSQKAWPWREQTSVLRVSDYYQNSTFGYLPRQHLMDFFIEKRFSSSQKTIRFELS